MKKVACDCASYIAAIFPDGNGAWVVAIRGTRRDCWVASPGPAAAQSLSRGVTAIAGGRLRNLLPWPTAWKLRRGCIDDDRKVVRPRTEAVRLSRRLGSQALLVTLERSGDCPPEAERPQRIVRGISRIRRKTSDRYLRIVAFRPASILDYRFGGCRRSVAVLKARCGRTVCQITPLSRSSMTTSPSARR